MKFIFKIVLLSILFFACDSDSCTGEMRFSNATNVRVEILPSNANFINDYPWDGDTIRIKTSGNYTFSYGLQGNDFEIRSSIFRKFDSVVVVFDNSDKVIHYRDSTKGNYERSLYNMEAYLKEGCTYTYTFTQQDYEAAKAGI